MLLLWQRNSINGKQSQLIHTFDLGSEEILWADINKNTLEKTFLFKGELTPTNYYRVPQVTKSEASGRLTAWFECI